MSEKYFIFLRALDDFACEIYMKLAYLLEINKIRIVVANSVCIYKKLRSLTKHPTSKYISK